MTAESHARASFTCRYCGQVAARLELVPPGEKTEDPEIPSSATEFVMDEWRLVVVGPIPATHTIFQGVDVLREILREADATRLHGRQPEYANFWCPKCEAAYCPDHWRLETALDEGFYDCTYGTCPQGHRLMLDD